MNHRTFLALFALVTPVLAFAGNAPVAATAKPSTQQSEMRAYLVHDGVSVQEPLFSDRASSIAVAKVDGEAITLQQLMESLSQAHEGRADGAAKQHDFHPVLERLIDIKLCVLEGRDMGLDDLPEVKRAIDDERRRQLINRVREITLRTVKPKADAVEREYRSAVREYTVRSLLFDKESDAKAFHADMLRKKDFDAVGKQLLDTKKAQGTTKVETTKASGMRPEVLKAISGAREKVWTLVKLGDAKTGQRWAVLQVLGTRYPDDPAARKAAEQRVLEGTREIETIKYYDALAKKHARIDKPLLKRLDFEAKRPGFAAFKKDQRPLVRIAGEKPITVADLASGLEGKFFHGIDAPLKEHRVNPAKYEVLYALLRNRLVLTESKRLKIEESEDFQRYMAEFRDATLFTAYVDRAVMPDVKVTEDEGRKYYEAHKAEFATPAMYKLESLTFASAKDGESALKKLRGGTDFMWMRANASGQVPEDKRAAQLDGVILSGNGVPLQLKAQLEGTKPGDYRLADIDGQSFVVRVARVTPSQQQPYEAARAAIGKKLIGENLSKALRDSAAKIRKAHQVDVYLTKIGY